MGVRKNGRRKRDKSNHLLCLSGTANTESNTLSLLDALTMHPGVAEIPEDASEHPYAMPGITARPSLVSCLPFFPATSTSPIAPPACPTRLHFPIALPDCTTRQHYPTALPGFTNRLHYINQPLLYKTNTLISFTHRAPPRRNLVDIPFSLIRDGRALGPRQQEVIRVRSTDP